jgi:hypothetical protein
MDLGSSTARRLRAAFPAAAAPDVASVLSVVEDSRLGASGHDIGPVVVGGEVLLIPARQYLPEPSADVVATLAGSARTVLGCLYTRHHDGHVRERFLRQVISSSLAWAPPFVIQLLGEYIIEAHEVVRENAAFLSHATYARFVAENQSFMRLTRQRVISYWNCYYRRRYPDIHHYPAHQLIEALAAQGSAGAARTGGGE